MIIGLVGFKQVGKSTAAKYLEEVFKFQRINMKDALVAEIKKNFPQLLEEIRRQYIDEEFEGMEDGEILDIDGLFKYKPPLMRFLLQEYGTEVRRHDRDTYWTDQWDQATFSARALQQNIVVDDVRFLNEAEALRNRKGIIIRLTRPDVPTGGSHASETEQLQIVADYTIDVEQGNQEGLFQQLADIYKEHNPLDDSWAPID